jgi:TP901 family phage tail tape measure protein
MADIESNIDININSAQAISAIKQLQAQLSRFYQDLSKSGAKASADAAVLQNKLVNSINATGKFAASIRTVTTTTESFTDSLERNKLSMGQYFKFAGSQVTGFRRLFSSEFDTIDKVARERVKTLQTQYIKLGRDANGAMQSIAVRPLSLDMNDLGTKVAMTAQKQQILNQLLTQGSTNLLNFGKNTQWAGRQLMVGFTIPLGIFGAAAAREFMKLEEQTIRFQKVYGDFTTSAEDTGRMTQSIRELAEEYTKYGIAIEKTMGMAADAAAMGNQGADLLAQVSQATRLAVLGGVEQEQALETTISLTNAFGVASDKLAGKINFLNAVENQTVTSIEDLTVAIPKAGPVVQQLGGDVEDLAFFMTAMKEGGIDAGEGANALKSGLASMINPTGQAADMLNSFGINLKGIVEANKGDIKGTVIEFAEALNELDPLNRAQAIEQLFGKFQFARLSTLFQNVTDQASQANRVLKLTNATTEELAVLSERELAKIEDSPMYQFQAAVEKFQASLAPVGESFLKAVTPIINFGTEILNKFNEMGDGAKQFWTIVVAAVAGLGPVLLMTFGLIANGAANIMKLFVVMGNAIRGVSGQSQLLGSSTEYMSSQQLEAAAIAASLNQVHQNLIQTFTSESQAVNMLTAAYQKAAAASGSITAAPIPRSGRVKKMARGGMVPGSGSGDTVPAMLTPGEFVLRKDVVDKYPGMIAGMMAGTIQGFNGGGKVVKKYSAPLEVRKQTKKMTWDTQEAEFEAIRKFAEENSIQESKSSEMLRLNASHIVPGKDGKVQENGVTGLFKKWFAKNLVPDLSVVNQYLNSLQQSKGVLDSFIKDQEFVNKVAKKYGISTEEVTKELESFKKGIHPTTKRGQSVLYEVANQDFNNAKARGPVTSGRASQAGGTAAGLGVRLSEDSDWFTTNTGRYKSASDKKANKQAENAAKSLARQEARTGGDTKVASEKSKAVTAERKAATARTQTATQQKNLAEAEARFAAQNAKFEEQYQKADRAERSRLTRAKNQWIKEQVNVIEQEKAQARSDRGKRAADTRRANQAAAKAANMEVATSEAQSQDAAIAMKENKRQRRAQLAGRVGTAGMVATMALGAATMIPGPVGEFAQGATPIAGGLSMLLPMLIGMPPQIALVVAALGAITAGIVVYNVELEKTKKAQRDLNEAVGSGTKAMEVLAEAAGTVTATSEAAKLREQQQVPFPILTGKETFGNTFLQSDAGKNMESQVKKYADDFGLDVAAEKIATQLSTAVFSEVLTKEQAQSIAVSLGDALNDYNFTIDVNANLIDVLGLDGESFAKNPLEVGIRLIGDQKANLDEVLVPLEERLAEIQEEVIFEDILTAEEVVNVVSAYGELRQVGQTVLDQLQREHLARKENLIAAGDLVGIEQEETKYLEDRAKILEANSKSAKEYLDLVSKLDMTAKLTLVDEAEAQAKSVFAGTEQEGKANSLIEKLANSTGGLQATARLAILGEVQAQNIPLTSFEKLINYFDPNNAESAKVIQLVANVVTDVGGTAGDQLINLVSLFGEDTEKAKDFVVNLTKGQSSTEVESMLNLFTELKAFGGTEQAKLILNFYANNEEKLEEIKEKFKELDELTLNGTKKITVEVAQQVISNPEDMNQLIADQEYFNGLDPVQQVTYIRAILTLQGSYDATQVRAEQEILQSGAKKGKKITAAEAESSLKSKQAKAITEMSQTFGNAADVLEEEGSSSGGGGGGSSKETSVLDDILKKLKRLQMATLQLKEGWAGARQALDALFPGGASNSPFQGIEQQMRRLGAREDLITMIAGMDPEEFEKRKNELFTFDGAGNIAGFRGSLLSIGAALRSIKFGEFQNEQQKNIGILRDQNDAIRKLIANGFSMAEAYSMVQDSAFASAIAQEANNDVIKQATEDYKEATAAAKLFAAAQSGAQANENVADRQGALSFISANTGNLSNEVINEILSNQEFANLIMSPTLTQEQKDILQEWIDNIENAAELELQVNLTNIEGMEKIFQDGFNMAMEAFSAQEKRIELEFAVKKDPFQRTVENAQNLISDIQNKPGGMDDLQADIERISFKEEDINKRYRERLDRLQEIKRNNDKILQQKRAELTVADAITQGDIAAAAKAIEDARAQQAQANMQAQQEMLQRQKDAELQALTGQMGLSREQIEMRIRDLRQEILNIEETMLEPAQYQLSLLERQEKRQRESLTILGMTRREWETLNNRIQVAKTSSDQYTKAMEAARDVVGKIVEYWTEIQKPKTTVHTIITNHVSSGSGGAGNIGASGNGGGGGGGGGGGNTPAGDPYPVSVYGSLQQGTFRSRYNNFIKAPSNIVPIRVKESNGSLWRSWNAVNDKSPGGAASIAAAAPLGKVMKSYGFNLGGLVPGVGSKDSIRSMLTPGEFVMTKPAVDAYGARMMKDINNGTFQSGSVYNYSVSVNVETGADADQIANTVMRKIKSVDAKRIQGNRF